jgi:non-heme chloroperoxidase
VSTRGVSATGMAYRRRGQGEAVVLLHGWCLSGRMWMYQEEALSQTHTVVSPDLAGFGRSAGLAPPYSLERYASDVAGLLDELQLERVTLVGFAFGAAVAMALAARGNPRIDRLVLIGVPSAAYAPYARMPRAMRSDWPDFARRSAAAICRGDHSEATMRWLSAIFEGTELPVAIETVGVLEHFEPLSIAAEIDVATLLVWGADDDVVPLEVGERLAAAMPDARLAVLPDCGHLAVLDQKEQLTALVEDRDGARI